MKNAFTLLAFLLLTGFWAAAQTVDDVMNGILVKKGEKIILKLDNSNNLFYDISNAAKTGNALDPVKYDDKSYFLIKRNSVNVYIVPVNPLNLAINSDIASRIDLITSTTETAILSIATGINKMQNPDVPDKTSAKAFKGMNKAQSNALIAKATTEQAKASDCKSNFQPHIDKFKEITNELEKDQKKEIAAAFAKLKGLSFEDENDTRIGLEGVDKSMTAINKHFEDLKKSIDDLEIAVKAFSCNDKDLEYLYSQNGLATIATFKSVLNNQVKRPPVLKSAYDLVNAAYKKAAMSSYNMMPWLVSVGSPIVTPGKITDFTVKVNKSGYELSADQEIQASKMEVANTYVLSFRKYDFWVPEVSAGIVYSNIDYPKFGTATDAAGKMIVASAGNDKVTKFSVTTMVNFNMYTPASLIHPFVQLGIGANADYPAVFLGGGLKISNSLSISGGAASPWIKKLKTLQEGSVISGTADLEKDLEREFKPFSKVYACFQIKL
jgi:hypothetical protein